MVDDDREPLRGDVRQQGEELGFVEVVRGGERVEPPAEEMVRGERVRDVEREVAVDADAGEALGLSARRRANAIIAPQ